MIMLPSPMDVCQIHGKIIQPPQEEAASAATYDTMNRPLNAFILWSLHQRRTKSFDNLCICEINKSLSAKWKRLTNEEKQPFIHEANRLDEEHKRNYPDFQYRPLLWLDPTMNPFLASCVTNSMPSTFLPSTNAQEFGSYLPEDRSNLLADKIPTHGMHSARYPVMSEDTNAQSVASTSSAAHYTQTQNALPCENEFDNFLQKAKRQKLNPIDSNASDSSLVHSRCHEPPLALVSKKVDRSAPKTNQPTSHEPPNLDQEYPLDLSIKKYQ